MRDNVLERVKYDREVAADVYRMSTVHHNKLCGLTGRRCAKYGPYKYCTIKWQ